MVCLYWYRALVTHAHTNYVDGSVLYAANHLAPTLDNCDQRVASDCRTVQGGKCDEGGMVAVQG